MAECKITFPMLIFFQLKLDICETGSVEFSMANTGKQPNERWINREKENKFT